MSDYTCGDVIVLLPEAYPIEEYWGQPLTVLQEFDDLYYCTDANNEMWVVAFEEIKGFYKNEDL